MPYDRFLIAPINTGLQTDLPVWQIPDDAMAQLDNAYIFRGRIRKRFGSLLTGDTQLESRLSVVLGSTNGSGNLSGTAPGSIFKVGQSFSIGTEIFTVYNAAAGANPMYTTGLASTCTFNLANGAFVFVGATPTTTAYFYPSEPVMGLTMYEAGAINNHTAYAFDTQFVYQYSGGEWVQFGPTTQFNGDNTDFFWSCNWQGTSPGQIALFTSNFNATIGTPGATDDPIWYYDGTAWATFTTPLGVINPNNSPTYPRAIKTARIILPFKNRLIMLNTIESTGADDGSGHNTNAAYVNRCRFSHSASPLATTAWWEPNVTNGGNYATGGGYIDAPTTEQIVSAQFIKDRLIVYFERSTWELAYTGNQVLPFVWNKLNTELGVEGTFSVVPFDTVVLGIGTTGIQACNGSNVERIDQKIPDEVFALVHKTDAVKRIAGIRDFKTEMVYWAAPMNAQDSATLYPDTILAYNYRNNSWAFFDDSFTAFGYFEQGDGRNWAESNFAWKTSQLTWTSGVSRANYREVIAGNQQGFILQIAPDESSNAMSLYITDVQVAIGGDTILTVIDHNLIDDDYIKIDNTNTGLDGNIYQVSVVDGNTLDIGGTVFSAPYAGGGTAARVSQIGILSKQWNPYISQGRNFSLAKVDFCALKTTNGQITVDYYPNSTELSLIDEAVDTDSNLGINILETSPYTYNRMEQMQDQLWHTVYFQGEGDCIQLYLYFSDDQMRNPLISESAFEIQGLILYCQPTSSRVR